jgi:hypothetical protein
MTINSTSRTAGPFTGDGVTKVFPFSFKVFARGDVLVATTNTATSVETILTLDSDYTVALNADQNGSPGGTITMTVAPAVGTTLAATSNIPYLQKADLTNQGGFYPRVINDALDKITIQIQQLASKVGLGLNVGAAATVTTVLNFIGLLATSTGTTLVGYIQDGVGAVLRPLQDRLRDTVSVKDFGVKGDGTDEYVNIKKAWDYCILKGKNLYFPAGVYSCGANNFPFKNPAFPATTLLDCGNITILGDGPATVLKTVSPAGADVLNLNFVKNLHFRNFLISADLTAFAGSGSNGISIVGAFDNLTFDGIICRNLAYVDKAAYLDGGKAFTIQPGTPTADCGTVKARIIAIGCVYGAGLEVDLVNWGAKKHAIDIDIVAENCYQGVIFSAGASSGALTNGMTMGYRVRAQLVNCQRSVVIARAHGVNIEAAIVTTLSAAARRLNPSGIAWNSVDSTVDGFTCTYAKNSRVSITGDVGGCDYKLQIGGATAGSSGIGGATEYCDFYFDLGGTSTTADFNLIDSGGNTLKNSRLYASSTTLTTIPAAAYAPSVNNTLTIGPTARLNTTVLAGELRFASSDGVSIFQKIFVGNSGLRLDFFSGGSSSASNVNYGFLKHDGTTVLFGVRNDGSLVTQGRATAASVTTVKQVIPIYDNTNTLVGYVPIYTSYA